MPRFAILLKATGVTEDTKPTKELFAAMTAYNESLVAAGVMQAGEGLASTKEGYRVVFPSGDNKAGGSSEPQVTKGPFPVGPGSNVVAGWWIFKTKDYEEALEWVKKIPQDASGGGEVEVRRIPEMDEFGDAFDEDLQKREERMRKEIEGQQQK